MLPGFAVEDGVALHFRGTRLERVVSSRPGACAYRIDPGGEGVLETSLDVAYLGTESQPRGEAVAA